HFIQHVQGRTAMAKEDDSHFLSCNILASYDLNLRAPPPPIPNPSPKYKRHNWSELASDVMLDMFDGTGAGGVGRDRAGSTIDNGTLGIHNSVFAPHGGSHSPQCTTVLNSNHTSRGIMSETASEQLEKKNGLRLLATAESAGARNIDEPWEPATQLATSADRDNGRKTIEGQSTKVACQHSLHSRMDVASAGSSSSPTQLSEPIFGPSFPENSNTRHRRRVQVTVLDPSHPTCLLYLKTSGTSLPPLHGKPSAQVGGGCWKCPPTRRHGGKDPSRI
ncbi:hypothetical protein BaRGS_00002421, partial [Batillaria attramentaria]